MTFLLRALEWYFLCGNSKWEVLCVLWVKLNFFKKVLRTVVHQCSWKVPAFNYIRLSSTQALASVTCHSAAQFLGMFLSGKKRRKKEWRSAWASDCFPQAVLWGHFLGPRDGRVLCCQGRGAIYDPEQVPSGPEFSRALSRGSTNRFFFFPGSLRVCGLVERCRPSPALFKYVDENQDRYVKVRERLVTVHVQFNPVGPRETSKELIWLILF